MWMGIFTLSIVGIAAAHGPLACNPGALSKVERQRHAALSEKLFAAIETRREAKWGYTFELDKVKFTLGELAEWAELERRCCPFFDFQISMERDDGRFSLTLGGGEGVKRVIEAEIGGRRDSGHRIPGAKR